VSNRKGARKVKTFVRGALALLFVAATANAEFEGVADMKITTHGGQANVTGTGKVYVSKAGYRSEMEMFNPQMEKTAGVKSMRMVSIGKPSDPDKVYMLNERMKTYAVLDTKKTRELASKMKSEKTERKYTVKRLGKDAVAGLSCDNVLITREGEKEQIEACVSKEFMMGDWLKAMQRQSHGGDDVFKALKDAGLEGYPIRMVTKQPDGAGMTMELTKVERRPIPASMFEIPPGYKETSMMGMMAQTPEQAKQMEEAQKQMEEAMKKMTPEQRKQMEEMMKSMGQQKK
jgi:hypothetical protein